MPLSDSKIRALVPSDRRYRVADGDGLCVVVEPLSKGGGKSFVGRFRFPPGRQGKQGDYIFGVYGRGFGQITLKAARDEWERVQDLEQENNKPPTDLKKDLQQEECGSKPVGPFRKRVMPGTSDYSAVSEKNKPEYRRLIQNQLIPEFGATTPVAHLEWDYKHPDGRTTRQWVVNYLDKTRERALTSASKLEFLPPNLRQRCSQQLDSGRSEPTW